MDNITHTIIGLAAGDLLHQSFSPESSSEMKATSTVTRRRMMLTACAVASNFPDLDLFLTKLIDGPLGYLLHHRGHTHTFLYEIPQALLLMGIIWLCWPAARALLKVSRTARWGLFTATALGFILHISMDFLNSYGVHPFYPFQSKWFYGDLVFIIEPFFWIACGIPLALSFERRAVRLFWTVTALAAPVAFTLKGYLPWWSFAGLFVTAALLVWVQKKVRGPDSEANSAGKLGTKRCLQVAFGLSLLFIAVQAVMSAQARQIISQTLSEKSPIRRLHDVALTALPTNPFCWSFVAVESETPADLFHLTAGRLSLWPTKVPVASCPSLRGEPAEQAKEIREGVLVLEEQTNPLGRLRELAKNNCRVGAWLKFGRIPALRDSELWDARFSPLGQSQNFSFMEIDETATTGSADCDTLDVRVPNWGTPREDMLE